MALFDAFLKIDGVTDNLPGGAIELESFSWGVSNSASAGSSGGSAGKASFQDFSITVRAGNQTPKLFEAAFKGNTIPNATLTVADKAEPITMVFSRVVISSYKFDEGPGSNQRERDGDLPLGAPMESVSFNFGQVSVSAGGTTTSGGTGGTGGLGGGVF